MAPGILPEANSSSVLTSTMGGCLAVTAAETSSYPQDMLDTREIEGDAPGERLVCCLRIHLTREIDLKFPKIEFSRGNYNITMKQLLKPRIMI